MITKSKPNITVVKTAIYVLISFDTETSNHQIESRLPRNQQIRMKYKSDTTWECFQSDMVPPSIEIYPKKVKNAKFQLFH